MSSSHTALQPMPMHSSLRLRPSAICVQQCWRQQSLQKVCPQSMAVASLAATSQKQHWHSSVSAWPAHGQTPAQHSLLARGITEAGVAQKHVCWIQEVVHGLLRITCRSVTEAPLFP